MGNMKPALAWLSIIEARPASGGGGYCSGCCCGGGGGGCSNFSSCSLFRGECLLWLFSRSWCLPRRLKYRLFYRSKWDEWGATNICLLFSMIILITRRVRIIIMLTMCLSSHLTQNKAVTTNCTISRCSIRCWFFWFRRLRISLLMNLVEIWLIPFLPSTEPWPPVFSIVQLSFFLWLCDRNKLWIRLTASWHTSVEIPKIERAILEQTYCNISKSFVYTILKEFKSPVIFYHSDHLIENRSKMKASHGQRFRVIKIMCGT